MCHQFMLTTGKSDAVIGNAGIENTDMENSFFQFDAFVSILKPKSLV